MKNRILKSVFILVVIASVMVINVPQKVVAKSNPGINGRIAYVGDSGSTWDIHTAKSDGSDIKNITNSTSTQDDPVFSPDGTKIVYSPTINFDHYEIYIMNADGSNKTHLIGESGYFSQYPSFSPDGTKIIFASNRDASGFEIYTANIDGSNITRLTNGSTEYVQPHFSPDGTKIVMRSYAIGNTDIFTMNPDGTNITNITNNSNAEIDPSWSPTGNRIVFARFIANYEIVTVNPDGTDTATLTNNGVIDNGPTWSPDGTKIAYREGTNSDVRVMNADGTNNSLLINLAQLRSAISWQPLTLGPTTTNTKPSLSLSSGKGTINIPSLYTDPYGAGVNAASVSITKAPSLGTTTINPTTGVISYTQNSVSMNKSFMNTVSSLFFPKASAETTDSFTYNVCSSTNSTLCSSGTVTVTSLLGAATKVGAPDTGIAPKETSFIGPVAVLSLLSLIVFRKKLHFS